MDDDARYKYIEIFTGGVPWYMMEKKDFISSINFRLKNENNEFLSFNGQSITSRKYIFLHKIKKVNL